VVPTLTNRVLQQSKMNELAKQQSNEEKASTIKFLEE
jgi:hypothetical protein